MMAEGYELGRPKPVDPTCQLKVKGGNECCPSLPYWVTDCKRERDVVVLAL